MLGLFQRRYLSDDLQVDELEVQERALVAGQVYFNRVEGGHLHVPVGFSYHHLAEEERKVREGQVA